uniref:Xylanolytic transcriptional activator regulatory domain-containing protein n=1 Tax=Psilocybe cubensis TaxID=181762 RepID=A0A8H8CI67_PSICU
MVRTIPPGEGSRFVLAATEHLRHKLRRMEARMRSLEDALAIAHSSATDRPHPLLGVRLELEADDSPKLKPVAEDSSTASLSASQSPGTLWLDGHGGTRFFGPSGGSESLLISSDESLESPLVHKIEPLLQDLDPSYLSPEINHCYQSFPFTPPNVMVSSVQNMIESFLPPMDVAITLCDTFLEHLSWMFHIVSRHKLVNELIPIIYKQNPVPYGPHDLALLLIVLGIGSLVDLTLIPYNLEAQHYYRLCRATLALQSVLGAPSVVTIKVLHLMSVYNGMSGKESNLEQSYVLLDLAGQVALRIGFRELEFLRLDTNTYMANTKNSHPDIDPSLWGFEGREAYDRRVYFWNLMAGVLWQSLVTGRPPSLLMSYIDCRIPTVEDENLFQEGEVPLGFGVWGFRASSELMVPLVRLALAVKPPAYDSVMELDRKIREFSLPRTDSHQTHDDRTAISMQIFVRSHYQELMLLFLHRSYFAQAMTEHPDNPLNSKYSQSVHAAYSSACIVLQDTRAQFMKKPLLCSRIWRIWSFTFSAAVIVGTLAIRGSHLNLKPPPLEQFESIFKIFVSAAETSSRAARSLPILQVMLQKARQAHKFYCEKGRPAPSCDQDTDELLYFGGQASIIQQREQDIFSGSRSSGSNESTPERVTQFSSQHPTEPGSPDTPIYKQHPAKEPSMSPPMPVAQPLASKPISISITPLTYSASPPLSNSSLPPECSRHASSSSRQVPMQRMVPSMGSPQYQTFADLSGGWNGGHDRHLEAPQQSSGSTSNSYQARGHNPRDEVMLDDRWASFMDYDVLREPPYYHEPSQ